mgnify:CR=1 FL=1
MVDQIDPTHSHPIKKWIQMDWIYMANVKPLSIATIYSSRISLDPTIQLLISSHLGIPQSSQKPNQLQIYLFFVQVISGILQSGKKPEPLQIDSFSSKWLRSGLETLICFSQEIFILIIIISNHQVKPMSNSGWLKNGPYQFLSYEFKTDSNSYSHRSSRGRILQQIHILSGFETGQVG